MDETMKQTSRTTAPEKVIDIDGDLTQLARKQRQILLPQKYLHWL